MELLKGVRVRVNPVGRLDYDVTGVLLLTNDGDLTHRLTHPRYGIPRTYRVKVRGTPSAKALERLERGVTLSDGPARAEGVRLERRLEASAWISLTLREGRNRLLKRMCETIGHPTLKVQRIRFAGLGQGALLPGGWRYLTSQEVRALRRWVGLEEEG
jgi:pseudouridine synthase